MTSYSVNSTKDALANIGVRPANTLGTSGVLTGIAYYFPTFAPTAASVTVGGRVTTASGRGISRARVTLTDSNGETRHTTTNSFGCFSFEEVQAGETYIFDICHKRYQFSPQVIIVNENVGNLNFVADSLVFIKSENLSDVLNFGN